MVTSPKKKCVLIVLIVTSLIGYGIFEYFTWVPTDIVIDATKDYSISIYQSLTTSDNQTFISDKPAYQIELDKDEYFTFDDWTISIK